MDEMRKEKYNLHSDCFEKSRDSNLEHDTFFCMLDCDDFEYFKHIRAVFGQHPSNLRYKKNSQRAFSSWPFENKILKHYDSDLYSNIYFDLSRKGWGYKFHLYLNEIEKFIEIVLLSVKYMLDEITSIVDNYITENCPGEISGFSELCIKEKISCLRKAVVERYSFDDYHYLLQSLLEIEHMIDFTSITNMQNETDKFIEEITISLDEIHFVISTCSNQDLHFYSGFYNSLMDSIGHHYYREKCAMYIYEDIRYSDIFGLVTKRISEVLKVSYSEKIGDFYYRLFLLYKHKIKAYD